MQFRTPSEGPQICPTCGTKLVAGDCVECDRPRATARGLKHQAVPARAYGEAAGRALEPVKDMRRASGEWLTQSTDDAPITRRAHPGQVRTALAEAELKAQQKAETQAVRKSTLNALKAVSDEAAAACALVSITAHLGLVRDAKLQAGETLFVNGGTGGVGSMVVQMAKAVGAKVVTTVGSAEKAKQASALGADRVINYKSEDVSAEIKKFTNGEGVHVWYETLREPD